MHPQTHVMIVHLAGTRRTAHQSVCRVHNTRTPWRRVTTLLTVNVTLDTREKMEARARVAVLVSTRRAWALRAVRHAQPTLLTLLMRLLVIVSLDTREKMEAHAYSASLVNTKQTLGLLIALIVRRILHPPLAASQTPLVNVMLVIRERVHAHAPSALSASTKQAWGLLLALIVH